MKNNFVTLQLDKIMSNFKNYKMSATPKDTKTRTSIYVLKNPDTNEIRYVGKTSKDLNRRLQQHIFESESEQRNKRKNWVAKILKGGKIPIIEEIDFCTWEGSQEKEIYWIKYYRDLGLDLVNSTDGGEGNLGFIKTEETVDKLKNSLRKRLNSIYQYDLQGNFIKEWENAPVAAETLNIKASGITRCLRKERFKYKNFIWSYEYNDSPSEVSQNLNVSIKNKTKLVATKGYSQSILAKIIKLEENYNLNKNIYIYNSEELEEDNFLYEAISLLDAGLWCIENRYSKASKATSMKSNISNACLNNVEYLGLNFTYNKPNFIEKIKPSGLLYLNLLNSNEEFIFKDILGLGNFIKTTDLVKANVINNMKKVTSTIVYKGDPCKIFWSINTKHCRLYKELYGELADKIEENPTMDNIELIN